MYKRHKPLERIWNKSKYVYCISVIYFLFSNIDKIKFLIYSKLKTSPSVINRREYLYEK